MPANAVHNYNSTCAALSSAIQDLELNIRLSEQNKHLRDNYTEQLRRHENNITVCNGVLETMKPMVVDIQKYINERRTESMQNINNALRLAGEIIPDSASGIYIKMEGDEAWLATSDDLTVQNTEGGGYRQVSSAFLRSVVLGSNPECLHTLILDEAFALVSQENTATLSLYLNVLTQDAQVICIEQKPEIKSNIDAVVYHFKKGDPYASVEKTYLKQREVTGGTNESQDNGVV